MSFEIVHLSDLHFGAPQPRLNRRGIDQALDTILSQVHAPTSFLIISGDIVFQGKEDKYAEALDVIAAAIERHKIDRSKVLVCPGNHDIVQESLGRQYFTSFDQWSSRIRNDKKCTFAGTPARLIEVEGSDFLLLNTAFTANKNAGQVDLSVIARLLETLPVQDPKTPNRLRVAIAHHHMIPVSAGEASTTQNAYPLLEILIKHGFSALLHGHQHAMLSLNVGHCRLLLSGIGSFGFPTPGYINSVAVYRGKGVSIETTEHFGLTMRRLFRSCRTSTSY